MKKQTVPELTEKLAKRLSAEAQDPAETRQRMARLKKYAGKPIRRFVGQSGTWQQDRGTLRVA